MAGITGSAREVRAQKRDAARSRARTSRRARRPDAGRRLGEEPLPRPYLRNTLWDAGYAVDTLETCVMWPQATAVMRAIEAGVRDVFAADDERVHAFTHLSHVYRQGC